jgi:hypothetical protein
VQEYRSISKQLSTVFNVLFSIVGSAAAVYVASITGAGYSRETAMLLAILAGVIVGIADGVLVWVLGKRVEKERKEARERGRKEALGSSKLGEITDGVLNGEGVTEAGEAGEAEGEDTVGESKISGVSSGLTDDVVPERRAIRLRRRPVGEAAPA